MTQTLETRAEQNRQARLAKIEEIQQAKRDLWKLEKQNRIIQAEIALRIGEETEA